LVGSLPKDFPAPVVLAQHLDPHRTSNLDTILERRSTLPIVLAWISTLQDRPNDLWQFCSKIIENSRFRGNRSARFLN
jgi:CheB methylesterase